MKKDIQKTAEIINIGDELLAGHTVNTNAAWMSSALKRAGIKVRKHLVIADEKDAIVGALRSVDENTDLIFITGGLGPTEDDRTKAVITNHFGGDLVFSEEIYREILELFSRRGRVPSERNREQAYFPDNAKRIRNKRGTASGMLFEKGGQQFYVLPGVPYEMQGMMEEQILPVLAEKDPDISLEQQINTFGLPESDIADTIMAHIPDIENHVTVGYYPSVRGITIRLNGRDASILLKIRERIVDLLGDAVYSLSGESMAALVVDQCKEKGLIISVAESCTGGLLCDMITDIPGSSAVFREGIVAYGNQAKIRELNVDPAIIAEHGAVSPQTVEAMAEGLRSKTGADITIGISGIAGPDGATPGKPVGLVYVAVCFRDKHHIQKIDYDRGRRKNKEYAAYAALNRVRLCLMESE